MPVYDILHREREGRPGEYPREIAVARLLGANGSKMAREWARQSPAPEGWVTTYRETFASRLVRRWQDAGDRAFAGREADYDALMLEIDTALLDDAQWPLTLSALCDLAEECGEVEGDFLAKITRTALSSPA
jgi:hypothetical protein